MRTVFTTADVSPGQRVDLWRTKLSETFAPVEIDSFLPKGFNARIETTTLGDLELSHFSGAEQGICRPRNIIRSSDADFVVAVMQLGGRLSYEHGNDNRAEISRSITILDLTREYRTMIHGRMNIIDVAVPRRRIEALVGPAHNLAGITIGPDQPITSIIIDFFRGQMKMANCLGAESAGRLATIGAELLAAGFLEKIGSVPGRSASATACCVRAKAFIRANLGEENLSPDMVARSQNLSVRRMQEIFAEDLITISDYIWEQRLLKAKLMLQSQAFAKLSVSDVAHSVGFASVPHFSRRFTARFGWTPAKIRRASTAANRTT